MSDVYNLMDEWSDGLDFEETKNTDDDQTAQGILDVYLAELKVHPRITPDREVKLGKRIKNGLAMMTELVLKSSVRNTDMKRLKRDVQNWQQKKIRPNLSESEAISLMRNRTAEMRDKYPDQEKIEKLAIRLARIEKKVREAMNELVTANLRLVIKTAKNYLGRGLGLSDLIQEGNMGLMKAAGRYDYASGFRFSTYSIWWIRQSIMRAIYDKARTVRLPVHLLETRNAYYRAYHSQSKNLDREPTLSEVAECMGVSEDKIDNLIVLIKDPLYLDEPRNDDGCSLSDFLVAEDSVNPVDNVNGQQLQKAINNILTELPGREERVLRLRYGIDTEKQMTLEEVGRDFNISRERVRQLENQALGRLRQPAKLQVLRSLI